MSRARSTYSAGDRFLIVGWGVLVAAMAAGILYSTWLLLLPLVAGYLISILLAPSVDSLNRRGLPRELAAMGVLMAGVATLVSIMVAAYPTINAQIVRFRLNSAAYLEAIESRMQGLVEILGRLVPTAELDRIRHDFVAFVNRQGQPFQSLEELVSLVGFFETVLLTFVVAFFLLARGVEIRRTVVSTVPNRYFEMALRLLHRVQTQTARYIRGQSLNSLANAVLISIALMILNVPYAPIIGVFAGLANAIPLVGPVAGALPAVLLCLLGATETPWWLVAAVLFGINMFDNFFIYPMTVGHSLQIPPFVVILGITVGAHTAGILGMFLAVPLLGLTRSLVLELFTSLRGFRIL